MARPKTPKQLQISINSLKKKVAKLEAQKKRAVAAIKKKAVKRKPAKKKAVKKRAVKRKVVKRKPVKRKAVKKKKRR